MTIRAIVAAAVAIAVCAPTAAVAQDSAPASTGAPLEASEVIWDKRPDVADFTALYPVAARNGQQNGRAAIQCAIDAEGRLLDCVLLGENPDGFGFGQAALRLAKRFRAGPVTKSGQATAGQRVQLKTTWVMF